MFSLNGKVLKDDQSYLFEAKQVLSGTDTFYKLRIYIDTYNYITIRYQQETELIQTMYFEVSTNQVVTNQSKLKIETIGLVSNVELISFENNVISTYHLSYNYEMPFQPIMIQYQHMENDVILESGDFTVTLTFNSSSNQMEYSINTPTSSQYDDDDEYDDDEYDDHEDDDDDDDEYEDDEYEDD